VVHPQVPANGGYALLPEHRAALFVKPRGKITAQRQVLMDLPPEGERFFTELVHPRPHTWRERHLPTAWPLFEQLHEERPEEGRHYCLDQGAIGGDYLQDWAAGVAGDSQIKHPASPPRVWLATFIPAVSVHTGLPSYAP
jgi:hypothetical protein